MLAVIVTLLSIATILVIVEILSRNGFMHGEYARKSIHIGAGLILATLPHFMSWREIVVLNVLFFVIVVLSRSLDVFSSVKDRKIKRSTFGEFLFPLGVAVSALMFKNPLVYSVAVLMLALADGLASIAGTWVKSAHYKIFGAEKTIFGSATFFVVAMILLFGFFQAIGLINSTTVVTSLVIATFLTVTEGAMSKGWDNIVVPVATGLILQQFIF